MKPIYKTPAGEKAVMALYDEALARCPVPYDALTIPTRHGDTFVIASGDAAAPPLVLIHGSVSNSAVWLGDFPTYSRRYRVYAVDLVGDAGKSAHNRPSWDSPAYTEWFDDVLTGLNIGQVTLVGISLGGWTSLKFATVHPERVEKLVLLCPGGVVPARKSFLLRAILLSMFGKRGMQRFMHDLFGNQSVPEGVIDIFTTVSTNFVPRTETQPVFTDDELRRLTMPVLMLGGSGDIAFDNERTAARLQQLLPQVRVTIIPGAGHALLNTVDPVMEFLAAEPAGAAAG